MAREERSLMQISHSDILSATQCLSQPTRVAHALLEALAFEEPECEHGVAFFAGLCSLALPLS